jgi:hypothetical protein
MSATRIELVDDRLESLITQQIQAGALRLKACD